VLAPLEVAEMLVEEPLQMVAVPDAEGVDGILFTVTVALPQPEDQHPPLLEL